MATKSERPCGEPAAFRVHWPGREPLMQCADHAGKLRRLSQVMGFHLTVDVVLNSDDTCTSVVKGGDDDNG